MNSYYLIRKINNHIIENRADDMRKKIKEKLTGQKHPEKFLNIISN